MKVHTGKHFITSCQFNFPFFHVAKGCKFEIGNFSITDPDWVAVGRSCQGLERWIIWKNVCACFFSPGCDDIIRQHKAACLRVTALLACRDLLWVGTSAGVIITVPLAHNTHRIQAPLNMVGIPYGHTGHVRSVVKGRLFTICTLITITKGMNP